MTTPYDRYQEVDSILRRALETKPGERDDLLSELCGPDIDLHQQVERLLVVAQQGGTLDPAFPLSIAFLDAPAHRDMIGSSLSHYEITAKLGEGGMGEVYRAKDTKLGRDVAIKVLPPSLAGDRDRLSRFEREARVLATLNHPNVAQVHGFDDDGGVHFLVMELAEGESLAERIRRGAIPFDEAIPIALQICEALEAAHERGNRSSGPQAKQYPRLSGNVDGSQSEGSRFRTGQGTGAFVVVRTGSNQLTDPDPAHGRWNADGDSGLHVPGAGSGVRGRRSFGRLGVRLCALRNAVGNARFRRRQRFGHFGGCSQGRAGRGSVAG